MKLEEKEVLIRKITASEGKIIVSKALDENGEPEIMAKELYLGINDLPENYEEIDDTEQEIEQ